MGREAGRARAKHEARRAKEAADWMREMEEMPLKDGVCYFIGDDKYVKIGFSVDPMRRLGELQNHPLMPPLTFMAYARGGRYRERYYHDLFAEHRARGEWFRHSPEIAAEIARLNEQVPA